MPANLRLLEARKMRNLKQQDAARLAGVLIAVLNAMENGKVRASGFGRVVGRRGWSPAAKKVARFYDVDPAFLWPDEAVRFCAEIMRQEELEDEA